MWRETPIGPTGTPGPASQQRTAPVMHLRGRTLLCGLGLKRGGFTLIELLTVITIIAILATLLMTTLSSVKRKAREAVCTSNLRQIGIALHLYLEDFGKRPATLEVLASAKYLGDGRILTCPADRAGAAKGPSAPLDSRSAFAPIAQTSTQAMHVSYQHPLAWSDEEWNRLMQAQTRAGVVVCAFHDVASASRSGASAPPAGDGLILRGQLDGTVVRRHFHASATGTAEGALPPSDGKSAVPTSSFAGSGNSAAVGAPAWELFSDDTPP